MLTPPPIFAYPIKRPGFITDCHFIGTPDDDEISLSISYINQEGMEVSIALYSTPAPGLATLCLPSTATLADLPEDVFTAHLRMAGMISGQIPGSTEYESAIKGTSSSNARDFQFPIGNVKVTDIVSGPGPRDLQVTFQKGSGTPRVITCDVADLATYVFAPSTQLLTVAGAIKKEFPTYIHDAASGKRLTQAQMDEITAYVMSLEPWI